MGDKTRKRWYCKDDRAMRRQKYEPHLHLRSRDCRLTQFKPDVMDIDVERTFSPKISPHSPRSRWMTFGALGYEERICWANCMRNWFPRFSTYVVTIHQRHRRTDRQTDDMRSQDRSLHYSASRGNNFLPISCWVDTFRKDHWKSKTVIMSLCYG